MESLLMLGGCLILIGVCLIGLGMSAKSTHPNTSREINTLGTVLCVVGMTIIMGVGLNGAR